MNKKELNSIRNKNQRKYHIPGQSHLYPRKRNAVFISSSNSLEHEVAKLKICWWLRKAKQEFITEAVAKDGRRHDVISLDTDIKYEVETDPRRAKRFEGQSDVVVVKLWKKFDKSIIYK